MHHFLVASGSIGPSEVRFSDTQQHQLSRVLRLQKGDEVLVLDGQGGQWRVRLEGEARNLHGSIIAPADLCREPAASLLLMVAPPRGERWEWLLQKGCEVGVAAFQPLMARYSQPGSATVKPRHYEILREATEQCRRLCLPQILPALNFAEALNSLNENEATHTVLLWEGAAGREERSLSTVLFPLLAGQHPAITLIIGPEGGFHPDEVALARSRGLAVAGLGPLIMRSETAAIVAAAQALALAEHRSL